MAQDMNTSGLPYQPEDGSSYSIGNSQFKQFTFSDFKRAIGMRETDPLQFREWTSKDGKKSGMFLTRNEGAIAVASVSRKLQDKLRNGEPLPASALISYITPAEGDVDADGNQREPFFCVVESGSSCVNGQVFATV